MQPHRLERLFAFLRVALELAQLLRESVWRCALKREDGLLLVAHCKECARQRARAAAHKKLRRQRLQNFPLVGRCVLRLVDQHMIDASVEFAMHPCGVRTLHQRIGTLHKVFKIEQAARLF